MSEKTLLIGWKGADWKLLLELMDSGKLPNTSKLVSSGAIGKIQSVIPTVESAVWTSVITGKRPHRHGVLGNIEPSKLGDSLGSASSLCRTTKAIWNILSQNNKKSQVVGWSASHPAEPINGTIVSNFFSLTPVTPTNKWNLHKQCISPPEMAVDLAELRMHPSEINGFDLLSFVPKLAEMKIADDPLLKEISKIISKTISLHAVSTELLEKNNWDFHSVFFSGISELSNLFINHQPPKLDFISDEDFEMYQGVVEAGYAFYDMLLGRLMELAGSNVNIILLSDQGAVSGKYRHNMSLDEPGGKPEHKEPGVLIMSGPNIKNDHLIYGSSILDITPTILYQLGLPVAKDMDGSILVDAFKEQIEPKFIESWDMIEGSDGMHPDKIRFDATSVKTIKIKEPNEEQANLIEHIETTINHLKFSFAESLMTSKEYISAISILEELWFKDKAESLYGYKLMLNYMSINKTDMARRSFDSILKYKKQYALESLKQWKCLNDKDPATLSFAEKTLKLKLWKRSRTNLSGMAFLHAWLLHAEKNYEQSLKVLAMADENKVYNLIGLLKLKADCLLSLKSLDDAKEIYLRILKLEDNNTEAYLGLANYFFHKKDYQTASEMSKASIAARYFNPLAHYLLGGSIFRCSKPELAVISLKTAIQQSPYLFGAYQRIIAIYKGPLADKSQANFYYKKYKAAQNEKEQLEIRALKQFDKLQLLN